MCNHCKHSLADQNHIFRECLHPDAVTSRNTLYNNLRYFLEKLRNAGESDAYVLCTNIFELAFGHPFGVRIWLSNYTKDLATAACHTIRLDRLTTPQIQRLSIILVQFQQIFVPAISDLWSTAQSLLYGLELPDKAHKFQSLYKYPLVTRAKKPRKRKQLQTPVPRPIERSVVSTRSQVSLSNISKISVLQKGQDIVDSDICSLPIDPELHELDNYADLIYDSSVLTNAEFAYQPP
jgi:hypothetical protein